MNKPARTLVDALSRAADRRDAGYSYVNEDGTVRFESFRELHAGARRIGAALTRYGLERGDRLGMILNDTQQFIETFFGAVLVGVVPVPIAPPPTRFGQAAGSIRHMEPVLTKCRPRLIVSSAHVQAQLLQPQLHDSARSFANVTFDGLLQGVSASDDCPEVRVTADDTAFLQFTSGSTSRPRGVIVTHANLVANLGVISEHGLKATPEDYCVSWLPLNHDMGLIGKVLVPMYAGMRGVLFMRPELFLKRPLSWLKHISQQRGTITFAPSFAYNLCVARASGKSVEGIDLSSLRIAGCGSEPVRCDVLESFARTFQPCGFRAQALLPCYGLAEHTLAATFSPIDKGVIVDRIETRALALGRAVPASCDASTSGRDVASIASCGPPFPGHEVSIVDDERNAVGERVVGEILLRGPSVACGYFEDAETSARTWRDGWLHTGDLGYRVNENLYICGRRKDLIIVHGRNYHPHDIEWEAAQAEGSRKGNIVAFSFEDYDLGREHVVVVAETNLTADRHAALEQAIRARLLEALSFAVDQVVLVPPRTLPKTSSGKLQRTQVRELFRSGKLWSVAAV